DEVHVLTSLAGFEALLRDKKVVWYGVPFYAGWGLTEGIRGENEHPAFARRKPSLTMDERVAAVLIDYPSYVSRATGRYCSPERAIEELLSWQGAHGKSTGIRQKLLRCLYSLRN